MSDIAIYVFVCNNYAFRGFSLRPNPFLECRYVNYLYVEMKVSRTISNSLDLDKYYPNNTINNI